MKSFKQLLSEISSSKFKDGDLVIYNKKTKGKLDVGAKSTYLTITSTTSSKHKKGDVIAFGIGQHEFKHLIKQ